LLPIEDLTRIAGILPACLLRNGLEARFTSNHFRYAATWVNTKSLES
jgi:hypothetical protein